MILYTVYSIYWQMGTVKLWSVYHKSGMEGCWVIWYKYTYIVLWLLCAGLVFITPLTPLTDWDTCYSFCRNTCSNSKYIVHGCNTTSLANNVCCKISQLIGIMYKLRSIAIERVIHTLYYCLVFSYLMYCTVVWRGTYPYLVHCTIVWGITKPLLSVLCYCVGRYYTHT